MILCKYFDNYGLDTLQHLRLKVAALNKSNDPFENSPYIEGDQIDYKYLKSYFKDPNNIDRLYRTYRHEIAATNKREFKRILRSWDKREIYEKIKSSMPVGLRETLKEQIERFSDVFRVLCFCRLDKIKPHEEILMWSHYSAGHTGVRISFDTSKFELKSRDLLEVTYQEERVKLELTAPGTFGNEARQRLGRALRVKSTGWAYECEYRWIIDKRECFSEKTNAGVIDFIKLPPEAVVTVDVGVRAPAQFCEAIKSSLRTEQLSHVDVRIATLDATKFQLNYKRDL